MLAPRDLNLTEGRVQPLHHAPDSFVGVSIACLYSYGFYFFCFERMSFFLSIHSHCLVDRSRNEPTYTRRYKSRDNTLFYRGPEWQVVTEPEMVLACNYSSSGTLFLGTGLMGDLRILSIAVSCHYVSQGNINGTEKLHRCPTELREWRTNW